MEMVMTMMVVVVVMGVRVMKRWMCVLWVRLNQL